MPRKIWIIDSDIAFSSELKALCEKYGERLIYYSAKEFREALKKVEKDKTKKPDVILAELNLPDESSLKVYIDLKSKNDPIADTIVFYSATNYGMFQGLSQAYKVDPKYFYEKSKIKQKIPEVVLLFDKPDSNTKIAVSFSQRKIIKDLKNKCDELEKWYYEGTQKSEEISPLLHGIADLAQKMGLKKFAEDLLYLVQMGPKLSEIKVKKEIKILLAVFAKEWAKWETNL